MPSFGSHILGGGGGGLALGSSPILVDETLTGVVSQLSCNLGGTITYSRISGTNVTVSAGGAVSFTTVLLNGVTRTLRARAQSTNGKAIELDVIFTGLTVVANVAPVWTSASTSSVAENTATAFYTCTATDANGDTVTFSIVGGADAARFAISGAALRFVSAPDYEAPNDAGTNNVYDVTLRASDGTAFTDLSLAVTVTDVADGVSVGDIIAARVAADGFTVELDIQGFKIGGNRTRGRISTGNIGAYSSGAQDTVQYPLDAFGTPKLTLSTSNRVGFDAAGAPSSTLSETFHGTVSRRNPYSAGSAHWTNDETNNTTYITIRVSIDKQVFAGETLTLSGLSDIYLDNAVGGSGLSSNAVSGLAVTNNSTEVAPLPQLDWLTVPNQRIGSGGITLELLATHYAGRARRMLAAAVITMTGVTSGNAVSKTVTAFTIPASMVRSGLPKGNVFAATFGSGDLTGFTQGEMVNVTVEGRPWIGSAFVSSTHGQAYPSVNMAQSIPFQIDKNDTLRAWATVDPSGTLTTETTGCNTTGTENTTAGTCYADIDRAIKALYTYMARNEIAHGRIFLRAGTYASFGGVTSTTGTSDGNCWVSITRAPSTTSAADVIITTTPGQSVTTRKVGGKVRFVDVTLRSVASATGGDNIFFYGSDTTATPSKFIWLDNCQIDGGVNTAGTPSAFLHQVGMAYWTNNNISRLDGTPFKAANGRGYPLIAGNLIANCGLMHPYVMACNKLTGGTYFQTPIGTANIPTATQMRADFCIWSGSNNNTLHHFGNATGTMPNGSSFGSSLLESFAGASNAAIQIGADRDKNPLDRHVSAFSLITGQRQNFLYNSEGTVAVKKRGVRRFCIYGGNQDAAPADDTYFIKSDTFADTFTTPGQQAGRTGNWGPRNGVDSLNNARLEQSFGQNHCSPTGEAGDFDPRTNSLNPGPISRSGLFVSDLSGTSHAGGGDYHHPLSGGATALYNLVPAGMAMYAYDLDGVARRDDGTGALGPYERTV